MREIARSLGISQPGLAHHFPTKVDLLTAVLDARDALSADAIAAASAAGSSHLDAIIAMVEANLRNPDLVRLFTTLSAESTGDGHPARAYFEARYETAIQYMATGLRHAAEAGEIRGVPDYDDAARVCMAVINGLQVQWLLDPTVDIVGLVRLFLERGFLPVTSR